MEASGLVSQVSESCQAARLPTGRPCPDSKARCSCAPVCCARVEHGWRGGGGWGHGRRGAGPARSSAPKTVFPGGRGTREAVFLLETSSTADATARTVLTGQAVQTIPRGCGPFLPSWLPGREGTTRLGHGPRPAREAIFISVALGILTPIQRGWFG